MAASSFQGKRLKCSTVRKRNLKRFGELKPTYLKAHFLGSVLMMRRIERGRSWTRRAPVATIGSSGRRKGTGLWPTRTLLGAALVVSLLLMSGVSAQAQQPFEVDTPSADTLFIQRNASDPPDPPDDGDPPDDPEDPEDPEPGTPVLEAVDNIVMVGNLDPGARILLIGQVRYFNGSLWERRTVHELVADDDEDTLVEYEFERDVPPESVWVAIDLATGAFTATGMEGRKPRPVQARDDLIQKSPGDRPSFVFIDEGFVNFWLVRPQFTNVGENAEPRPDAGAWWSSVYDAEPDDADETANAQVLLDLLNMEALGDSPIVPDELRKKDIIIAIGPRSLAFVAVRVNKGLLQGNAGGGA